MITTESIIIPECAQEIESAPPFTYFVDSNGIIYYSCGIGTHPAKGFIRSTAVYFPTNDGDRTSPYLNTPYSKYIIHGYTDQEQLDMLPDRQRNLSLLSFRYDPTTEETVLAVPSSTVEYIFDPHLALNELLESTTYPCLVRNRVNTVVNTFVLAGIPYSDIGIYGSLQTGLTPNDPQALKEFNDVDLVIYGTHHYERVTNLASIHHNGQNGKKSTVVMGEHNLLARKRRQQLSKLHFHDEQGTFFSDVKVVHAPNESPSIAIEGIRDQVCINQGVVHAAHESLGYPSIWRVKTIDGGDLAVYSRMYDNIGAAGIGDLVNVKGRLSSDGSTVVLTNNKEHYIYSSTENENGTI